MAITGTAGLSWQAGTPPPAGSTGVRFANSQVGYAWSSHQLSVTLDGGRSWQPPRPETDITALEIWGDKVLVGNESHLYEAALGSVSLTMVSSAYLGTVTGIAGP